MRWKVKESLEHIIEELTEPVERLQPSDESWAASMEVLSASISSADEAGNGGRGLECVQQIAR